MHSGALSGRGTAKISEKHKVRTQVLQNDYSKVRWSNLAENSLLSIFQLEV